MNPDAARGSALQLLEVSCEVLNHEGIHARPAARFVRAARGFESRIDIVRDSQCFSAKSILDVLSANLNRGTVFTLRAEGRDAREAAEILARLLHSFAQEEH